MHGYDLCGCEVGLWGRISERVLVLFFTKNGTLFGYFFYSCQLLFLLNLLLQVLQYRLLVGDVVDVLCGCVVCV